MAHLFPQLGFDGAGIGVVSITGDPLRDTTSDCARGPKEGFRCCLVPLLTEQNIDQIPISIDRPVEVDQAPFDFKESLVHIPAAPDSPSSMLAQRLAQEWSELRFPLPYCLMGKDGSIRYFLRCFCCDVVSLLCR